MVSEGRNGQGRVSRSRIGYFDEFSGLWGVGFVSSCLVHGPGVPGVGSSGLECKTQLRGRGEGPLAGELFIISRNWLQG